MAIDEIEGETSDNTNPLSTGTNAFDDKLDGGKKSTSENAGNGINCTNEDDDVIILETNDPTSTFVIIDDDDEHVQEINLGKSQHSLLASGKNLSKPQSFEKSGSHALQHEVVTGNLEQVNTGLKSLSDIPDFLFSGTSSRRTNEFDEVESNSRQTSRNEVDLGAQIIMENSNLTVQSQQEVNQQGLQITEERCDQKGRNNNDGHKALSEISRVSSNRSITEAESVFVLDESDTSEEIISGSSETSNWPVSSTSTSEDRNFFRHNDETTRRQVAEVKEKSHKERGKQVELQTVKNEDLRFHLNKIFESNIFNNEERRSSPFVVKMNDTPVIISENGVVTVIYKPEKINLRRKIEDIESLSKRMSPCIDERTEEETVKRRKKFSSNSNSKGPEYRRVHPDQENNSRRDVLRKTKEGPRLADVKEQTISGIRRMKKKYPPIRKVKYKGKMVYKCKECDFVHPDKVAALRRHMVRHQPLDSVNWYYCDLCNYKAKRKGNLKVHMILHRDPDEVVWYKCETCDKKFKHKNGLYDHEKRHMKRENLELYLCDKCSYKSPFKHTLLRHKISHEPAEKKKLLTCTVCSYSTYNKYYLSRHRQTHSEPIYKCLFCKYEAKYKANLERHIKTHFPEEEILYCDSCNFSTNRRYTLTLHNRNVHNIYSSQEDQMYFCYNCSFQTRFKRCLVKHASIHSGATEDSQETITRIKTETTSD